MTAILGLLMVYATVHFLIVQWKRGYEHRSTYEQVVTWVGMISIALVYWGVMFG
jgi:hypothetical protein